MRDATLQVRSSSEPPVKGIFPLELTLVLTLLPKTRLDEPRSRLCPHVFHRTDSKDLTFMP